MKNLRYRIRVELEMDGHEPIEVETAIYDPVSKTLKLSHPRRVLEEVVSSHVYRSLQRLRSHPS
jgi:hypothetical protein